MITRRSFLARNYKLAISLPLLGVFEKIALCQDQAGDIRRFVTYSFPNGCAADLWKFDQCLSPLSDIRDRLLVFENTRNMVTETFGGDGHQQGAASMFVGAPMKNDIQKMKTYQTMIRRIMEENFRKSQEKSKPWAFHGGESSDHQFSFLDYVGQP